MQGIRDKYNCKKHEETAFCVSPFSELTPPSLFPHHIYIYIYTGMETVVPNLTISGGSICVTLGITIPGKRFYAAGKSCFTSIGITVESRRRELL